MSYRGITQAERDRAVLAIVKWRAVLRNATTTRAKLDAARAIDLLERKIRATPDARSGG